VKYNYDTEKLYNFKNTNINEHIFVHELNIRDSLMEFWKRSEYSDIKARKLEGACACCDMHASFTQQIYSVAVRLADLTDSGGTCSG
jgi:hypothetical protein